MCTEEFTNPKCTAGRIFPKATHLWDHWGNIQDVTRQFPHHPFLVITPRSVSALFFFFFWPHCEACGILVPQPGIEPVPSATTVQSLNHWTAGEFPE